ncbi:PAS domain S-box protein [Vibrio sp. T187]|uniref:MHYT domain-containing protein n=1 Tax=Vibrio TaxID=662 RepID=UPI0010C956C0|nr:MULTISPECIES: MHYT domain-containing protein [Vibrio]MBW3696027.1 PAS domain S-box protein [Vibrio sp. T187]
MFEFWRFQSVNEQNYLLLEGQFNVYLILLSVAISSLAAYSCLIVIERMWFSNNAKTVKLWRVFGSIVFGLGVWAMHFTGMLAFMIPVPMSYDPGLTLLSLVPPIFGAFFAFQILSKQDFSAINIQMSALYLALGIGSMHFIGMEAMKMDVLMVYDFTLFVLSIVVAHLFACIAIYLIKLQNQSYNEEVHRRFFVSTIMGLSVAGMHYTAMGSVSFYAANGASNIGMHMSNAHMIALVVAFFAIVIVAATAFCSIVDNRLQIAESSVEASLTREKDIVNNLADGLIIVNETGVIDSINFMGLKMFDYKESLITGKNIQDLMPKFDRNTLPAEDVALLDHQTNIAMEAMRSNGQMFPVEVSISAMSTRHDDMRLFNCVIRDISARLELEQQLRQAQKLESMGQLAAGIAHEINTPTQYVSDNTVFLKDAFQSCLNTINSVKTLTESHQNQAIEDYPQQIMNELSQNDIGFMTEEIPLALDQSLEGLQRINKIVRAMKSFSHSSNYEKQNVDIAEAIESTITIARGEWRYVAKVETDFDENLPTVPCYRDEFNQVILNFVINAAHAIQERYADIDDCLGLIKISTQLSGNDAVIKIEDNGVGIPENIINRIFDPFFTTKDVGKGTGQGLNLAYSVITDLHKGKIKTESTPGEGTTFSIILPLEMAQENPSSIDNNQESELSDSTEGGYRESLTG